MRRRGQTAGDHLNQLRSILDGTDDDIALLGKLMDGTYGKYTLQEDTENNPGFFIGCGGGGGGGGGGGEIARLLSISAHAWAHAPHATAALPPPPLLLRLRLLRLLLLRLLLLPPPPPPPLLPLLPVTGSSCWTQCWLQGLWVGGRVA